jgi:hypothetical protein
VHIRRPQRALSPCQVLRPPAAPLHLGTLLSERPSYVAVQSGNTSSVIRPTSLREGCDDFAYIPIPTFRGHKKSAGGKLPSRGDQPQPAL